jgi:hypothetical protein
VAPFAASVAIVDQVDAAAESDAAVDDDELAMQATQSMPPEPEALAFRPVDEDAHAGGFEDLAERIDEIGRTESVDEHVHGDAAAGGIGERQRDAAARRVVLEDVGLDVHLAPGGRDRGFERGEILVTGAQQIHAVAGDERGHVRTSNAERATWSDMRADWRPWWAWASFTRKPRV